MDQNGRDATPDFQKARSYENFLKSKIHEKQPTRSGKKRIGSHSSSVSAFSQIRRPNENAEGGETNELRRSMVTRPTNDYSALPDYLIVRNNLTKNLEVDDSQQHEQDKQPSKSVEAGNRLYL